MMSCNYSIARMELTKQTLSCKEAMPRLVGKQSNMNLYIVLVVLAGVVSFLGLEYTGKIDIVPGFGKVPTLTNQQK